MQTVKNFEKCPCGGSYRDQIIEVRMNVSGVAVLLEGISQGTCPSCGSRVYMPEDLKRIEDIMHERCHLESTESEASMND